MSRDSSDSRRDDRDGHGANSATTAFANVETPLLATDLPSEVVPKRSVQQTVIVMSCIYIALVETYSFLTSAPMQEIMEDFICHSHYPDHAMNEPQLQDRRCKEPEVQKVLAMVRSWLASCEMWVPLFIQMPYGIIADKYGRRPVLFLSLFGILLEGLLMIAILLHPQTFSPWTIIWTSLCYFIGGGPPMATAMVWTILCDAVPASERTTAFYRISALGIILSAILNPIAAWLMSIDPWLPMWIGISCMALGAFAAFLVPETLRLRKEADALHRGHDSAANEALLPSEEPHSPRRAVPPKAYAQELLSGAKENFKHICRFILASKSVMLLVGAIGTFFPIKLAYEAFLLQYTTKRFDWSWSTATYYYTITKVTGVLMLLIVLPIISKLISRGLGDHPLKRDLCLARGSIFFVIAACLLAAVAYAPPVLVLSLVLYGMGVGFLPQTRALATGVVEPHTLATLNTMVSTTETFMGSVGAPAFGWLMSRGMDLGGPWLGLPFLSAAVFGATACILVWLFRIPQEFL